MIKECTLNNIWKNTYNYVDIEIPSIIVISNNIICLCCNTIFYNLFYIISSHCNITTSNRVYIDLDLQGCRRTYSSLKINECIQNK